MERLPSNNRHCERVVHTLCPTHLKTVTKNYILACDHGNREYHFSRFLTIIEPCETEQLNVCAWKNHLTGAIRQNFSIAREFAHPNTKQFCSLRLYTTCLRHDKLNHFNYVRTCNHSKEDYHYTILAFALVDFAFCKCDSETFILPT